MRRLWDAVSSERRARRFLIANLVDDVGVAVSVWAMQLLQTDLMRDQHARAALVVPVLFVMVLGTLLAGPLADYARRWSPAMLPRWRRDVLLVARSVETLALGGLVVLIASGPVTIGRILPYALVSGFLKTALRPTRMALAVDLLDHERAHLPVFAALTSQMSSVAVVAGLLLGGRMMSLAAGHVWTLFAFDVLTNVVFLAVVATVPVSARHAHLHVHAPPSRFELLRFLGARAQRPLVAILFGAWMVEFIDELYDGRMIVRHVLGGAADAVRFSEIGWTLASFAALAALPALLARVRLEVAFVAAMLADGVAVALAGTLAARGAPSAIFPFALVLGADRALTALASTMADVAQARATTSAMRGRLNGAWQLFVIVTCIFAEGAATVAADGFGIGPMMRAAGLAQIGAIALLATFAMRRFTARAPA